MHMGRYSSNLWPNTHAHAYVAIIVNKVMVGGGK